MKINNQSNSLEQNIPKINQELLENVNWYRVACKIREQNRQLETKILDLETSLIETNKRLETQQRLCNSADDLIEQKTQELDNYEMEISQLSHKLDQANQGYQNQQIFIESLSQQLHTAQEKVARLEREWALLQDNYAHQKQTLLQVEKQNKELEIRLQRQQHYTLQFKAALDQCLKAPSSENLEKILEGKVNIKQQKIKPWSTIQEDNNTSVTDNLHKKLLSSKEVEVNDFEIKELIENEENPINIENLEDVNLIENNQEKEITFDLDQKNNLDFPFIASQNDSIIEPLNTINSTNNTSGILLDINSQKNPIPQKKKFLKLPKFLQ